MDIQNARIMADARAALVGNWKRVILVFLLYTICMSAVSAIPEIGGVVSFLISGPMALGVAYYSLGISRGEHPDWKVIFDGFKRFIPSFLTYIYMTLLVILWSLLLIIPGILKSLSYSQTFFILADNPLIGVKDAVKKSEELMKGYRWKYVCLNLRFFGWMILSVFTLGIGFLWLIPYMQVSYAKFYDELNAKGVQSDPS